MLCFLLSYVGICTAEGDNYVLTLQTARYLAKSLQKADVFELCRRVCAEYTSASCNLQSHIEDFYIPHRELTFYVSAPAAAPTAAAPAAAAAAAFKRSGHRRLLWVFSPHTEHL